MAALLDVIDSGATRCGATATAVILDDFKRMREEATKKTSTSNPESN